MYTPRIKCYGMTRPGKGRTVNDDQFQIADLRKAVEIRYSSLPNDWDNPINGNPQTKLLLVADGIGRGQTGKICQDLITRTDQHGGDDNCTLVAVSFSKPNRRKAIMKAVQTEKIPA